MRKNKPRGVKSFQKTIWDFYKKNKRDFPWRETFDPYKILISEVMLQQTQTYRVQPKYEQWIEHFPTFKHLAKAPFSEILKHWSGLGYNRRALYLHTTAKKVIGEHTGKLPMDPQVLETFPGIGKNTAGSVYVFSTNKPHVFIETNTRRVFIHYFFSDQQDVHDKEILKLIEQTLPEKNPREWYYALMDYGNYLAKQTINPNRKSKHYTKQSKFEGSLRKVRGQILKILLKQKSAKISELKDQINSDYLATALEQLEKEGFITRTPKKITIKIFT